MQKIFLVFLIGFLGQTSAFAAGKVIPWSDSRHPRHEEWKWQQLEPFIREANQAIDTCLDYIGRGNDAEAVKLYEGMTGPGKLLCEAKFFAQSHNTQANAEFTALEARYASLQVKRTFCFKKKRSSL